MEGTKGLDGIPFADSKFEFSDAEKSATKHVRGQLQEAQVLHDLNYLEASEEQCRKLLREPISEYHRLCALILLFNRLPNADWETKEKLRLEGDLRMAALRAFHPVGDKAFMDFALDPLQEELWKMRREQMRPADGYVAPIETSDEEDESDGETGEVRPHWFPGHLIRF